MSADSLSLETEQWVTRLGDSSRGFDADMVDDKIVRDIVYQWGEYAEHLEQAALRLESVPEDTAPEAEIKRTLHSIKGDAGVCGLTEVADVVHELESLLERYLERHTCPADLLLRVTDWLRDFLGDLTAGTPQQKTSSRQPEMSNKQPITRRTRFSMKILIAEDDMTSRAMLQAVLAKWGYDVTAASDGEQAWAALQKPTPPGLAVLDWEMPGLDGAELCRRLRAQERKEPLYLILLTSRGAPEDIVRGLEAGADDYIAKPYDNAELKARVDAGRRTLRLQAEIRRYAEEMEALARERAVQLAHSDRMATLGILSAGIAHEINNPTSFIAVSTQTLEQNWGPVQACLDGEATTQQADQARLIAAEVPAILEDIKSGVQRIQGIVNGLKTYSRADSRKQGDVRVADCVAAALRLCTNRIKYHVTVDNRLSNDLPGVLANASELEQVFINLFVNAADAMQETGGGTLTLTGDASKSGVCIRVRDTGPGLPDVRMGRVFAPFFTTKKIGQGTGLGLSISRNIIEDHCGTLTARNHPDGGAEFSVCLPVPGAGNARTGPPAGTDNTTKEAD